ncbi:hypothetical protein MSAN_00397900 [Mycena sanguinolenta]|uniref:Multiple myeloma tumor-associated protein 2-like N-terminal domain-containing protein n=1 Tax=Mycena sanguinolenta TaxID=230812 RepID=A0A8H7DI28_9AGAR|nr:hypothetical protein MSAN_00397900 [Mycena sanguinolenta]
MAMMFEPIRGGTRGGQAEFKWSDVSADKDRENYLGHSINAPTGRWQKNKDVHWYNRDVKQTDEERNEEIRKIKEAEADALAVALGFEPAPKSANPQPAESSSGSPKAPEDPNTAGLEKAAEKAEARRQKALRKEERRARKEQRRLERRERERDEPNYHDRRHRDRSRIAMRRATTVVTVVTTPVRALLPVAGYLQNQKRMNAQIEVDMNVGLNAEIAGAAPLFLAEAALLEPTARETLPTARTLTRPANVSFRHLVDKHCKTILIQILTRLDPPWTFKSV